MPIPPTISSEERMEVIAAVGKLHDYALRALLHDLQPAYYRMSLPYTCGLFYEMLSREHGRRLDVLNLRTEYRAQRQYKDDMPRLRVVNMINSLVNWRRLPK